MEADQLANSVHWYGHVFGRKDYPVLRRALEFDVEDQRKKGRKKVTWKMHVVEVHEELLARMHIKQAKRHWPVK